MSLVYELTINTAPIFDEVDLTPKLQMINGAVRDNNSIYRQDPSPEVDAEWDRISTEGYEVIGVTPADVSLSGKTPLNTLKAPLSWHLGPDTYIVQIEAFHQVVVLRSLSKRQDPHCIQIHCLNELRKEIHYDYYYGGKPTNAIHREHKTHCIHILLQNLMCNADVGIITHNWVHNEHIQEPKDRIMPDFNTGKMCRNFGALLDWATENGIRDLGKKITALRLPEGTSIVDGDGYA